MFQPQITGPNSAAHFTGLLATLDEYRRKNAKGHEDKTQKGHSSRLLSRISSLVSRLKGSQVKDAAAKNAAA